MSENKTKFEEKTFQSDAFGEITMGTNGEFNVSNKNFETFLDTHGCPNSKEVRGALQSAQNAALEEAVLFMKNHVIERKDRCTMNLGTGNGRMEVTLNAKSTNINPQTREEVVSYGKTSVKMQMKAPSALREGTLAKVAEDIAKALS